MMKKSILNYKVKNWIEEVEREDKLPSLSSFFKHSKLSRNKINGWKDAEPELYKIYDEKVRLYVEYKLNDILLNGNANKQVAIMFYLKCAFHYRENDTTNINNNIPNIYINTKNKGQNKLNKEESNNER